MISKFCLLVLPVFIVFGTAFAGKKPSGKSLAGNKDLIKFCEAVYDYALEDFSSGGGCMGDDCVAWHKEKAKHERAIEKLRVLMKKANKSTGRELWFGPAGTSVSVAKECCEVDSKKFLGGDDCFTFTHW